MSVAYLENSVVAAKIAEQGLVFRKKEKTGLRRPFASEIGQEFPTFVNDGHSFRRESLTVIGENVVIARNSTLLGKTAEGQDVFNEWPIPMKTAIKNYGADVIDGLNDKSFAYHTKKSTIKAILLSSEILQDLGLPSDVDTLKIKVSWSEEPMIAKVGDFLTSGGYSISNNDMKAYEAVSPVSVGHVVLPVVTKQEFSKVSKKIGDLREVYAKPDPKAPAP